MYPTIVHRSNPGVSLSWPSVTTTRPAAERLCRTYRDRGKAKLEYLPRGCTTWGTKAVLPLQDSRLVLDNGAFDVFRDVTSAWEYLTSLRELEPDEQGKVKKSKPTNPQLVIDRLQNARETKTPLFLFIPWGPRPSGEPENEMKVLDRIKEVADALEGFNIPVQPLIMPADLYATEINRALSPDHVSRYFDFIRHEAEQRGFLVMPWSQIRSNNNTCYSELKEQLNTEDKIIAALLYAFYDENGMSPPRTAIKKTENAVSSAIKQASNRSGFTTDQDIRNAAFAYLRERLIEAMIVNETIKPVKLSAVSNNKDIFDAGYLPTIYVFPNKLQFPWLLHYDQRQNRKNGSGPYKIEGLEHQIIECFKRTLLAVRTQQVRQTKPESPLYLKPSAQLVSAWRAMDEDLSGDTLAKEFVNDDGRKAAAKFLETTNPTADRLISIRNRYMDEQVIKLIRSGYNQFVYLASGLNTSPYRLRQFDCCKVVEVDLPDMVNYKEAKIEELRDRRIVTCQTKPVYLGIDLNDSQKLISDLSQHLISAKPTVFVIEGFSYFIGKDNFRKLIEEIEHEYPNCAFIIDYWPPEIKESATGKRVIQAFNTGNEQVFSIYTPDEIVSLLGRNRTIDDKPASEIERRYVESNRLHLVNNDNMVNAYFVVAKPAKK